MGYEAKILADSICNGKRLTTFQATYPRFVHSELLTHRMLSRNSSSSRAIPTEKLMRQIKDDPAMPVYWGRNQSGMQAAKELEGIALTQTRAEWLAARDAALAHAADLSGGGLHKQIANRVLEPWMFITVIVSATEWENFFRLRCHPAAQPEIAKIAWMMKELYEGGKPQGLNPGEWHLPLLFDGTGVGADDASMTDNTAKKVCVARCARVSYLTHEGKRDLAADVELCDRLAVSGHWSPFEHVATPVEEAHVFDGHANIVATRSPRIGNFIGWRQYRADVDPNFIR